MCIYRLTMLQKWLHMFQWLENLGVHYAGFFDPGFGHNAAGGSGARGVLEVRCHEAPFVLEHGQVVGRLIYEKMSYQPTKLYGQGVQSNYQGQGLKLSKHFKKSH